MLNSLLLEQARLFVRRWFARHMPKQLYFHDLEHTLAVVRAAADIGRHCGLSEKDLLVVELAALFHDTGYARTYQGHEEVSAEKAAHFLQRNRCSAREVAQVRTLILCTRLHAVPRNLPQQVLRDADSAKAGQPDFLERSEQLRRELERQFGRRIGKHEWLLTNQEYLRNHRFHTAYAKARFGAQKRLNQQALARALDKAGTAQAPPVQHRYMDREISWLSFNARVLQEAGDPQVPLLERLKFLAIYSSNLDEFYRVRVAQLRSLVKLGKRQRNALQVAPEDRIVRINRMALAQQQAFGQLYRNVLLPALAKEGIRLLAPETLNAAQSLAATAYFKSKVAPLLQTAVVRPGNAPFIEDRKLYLACEVRTKGTRRRLVLLNVPSGELGRFFQLPSKDARADILFLDDIIRANLRELFGGHKIEACHAIKLSRDADLYLDEEFAGSVQEKVRKSLRKRQTGMPARFLYDGAMPKRMLRALRTLLALKRADLVPGGRYHHLSDLLHLPVKGRPALRDKVWPSLQHPALSPGKQIGRSLARRDVLLHFPYHDFGQVVRWLQTAATNPRVARISITLYRVAENSMVCETLLTALRNGKEVLAVVEVQARFDERVNLLWGERLEKAGATVIYGTVGRKVHSKLALVETRRGSATHAQALLSTGNFNERTAQVYSDSALITSDRRMTREAAEVFKYLRNPKYRPSLRHLLLAPEELRSRAEELIDRESARALQGQRAEITLKLNSLEDRALIDKLYAASRSGVSIRLIVRGICCLVPGVSGTSDTVQAISIVDRYLEHARAYVFHNAGDPLVYLSSADWMERNMDRRVEVAFPIYDARARAEVLHMLDLQWNDTAKARVLDAKQTNPRRRGPSGKPSLRSQQAFYDYLVKAAAPQGADA
jgi:polyphosphate kinase